MIIRTPLLVLLGLSLSLAAIAKDVPAIKHDSVSDEFVAQQRQNLAENSKGKGFGPQSPRDIDSKSGSNTIAFSAAPAYSEMNLCNIHFHKNAEHKGGEFTKHAGNGDGKGYSTGFKYAGKLSEQERVAVATGVCSGAHGALNSGDTIELHYVHSTAAITPGPTLGSCLSESIQNPQLRVVAQVYVLVNDANANDFHQLTQHGVVNGVHQALNIPQDAGVAIEYTGSTTGPSFNETGSPLQVSWSVRPKVVKTSVASLGKWCEQNVFNEDHAHGVRNLVVNTDLLSEISP